MATAIVKFQCLISVCYSTFNGECWNLCQDTLSVQTGCMGIFGVPDIIFRQWSLTSDWLRDVKITRQQALPFPNDSPSGSISSNLKTTSFTPSEPPDGTRLWFTIFILQQQSPLPLWFHFHPLKPATSRNQCLFLKVFVLVHICLEFILLNCTKHPYSKRLKFSNTDIFVV